MSVISSDWTALCVVADSEGPFYLSVGVPVTSSLWMQESSVFEDHKGQVQENSSFRRIYSPLFSVQSFQANSSSGPVSKQQMDPQDPLC